jgi:hypothetical protein
MYIYIYIYTHTNYLVVKLSELGVEQPPSSSAEVKEGVQLYIYSISGIS